MVVALSNFALNADAPKAARGLARRSAAIQMKRVCSNATDKVVCGPAVRNFFAMAFVVAVVFYPATTTLGQQSLEKTASDAPTYTILPGKGLGKCSIGMPVQHAVKLFGKPDKDEKGYIQFLQQGVEAKVEDAKIVTLFFHYRSKTVMTFDGETDKGIGMWSTIPQVLRRYGKPSRIGDSIVSEFGPMPGARDYTIEYTKAGISFTFYNNELAYITGYAANR